MSAEFIVKFFLTMGFILLVKIGMYLGKKAFPGKAEKNPTELEKEYTFENQGTSFAVRSVAFTPVSNLDKVKWSDKMVIALFDTGYQVLNDRYELQKFKDEIDSETQVFYSQFFRSDTYRK